jgi:hypothetical protein
MHVSCFHATIRACVLLCAEMTPHNADGTHGCERYLVERRILIPAHPNILRGHERNDLCDVIPANDKSHKDRFLFIALHSRMKRIFSSIKCPCIHNDCRSITSFSVWSLTRDLTRKAVAACYYYYYYSCSYSPYLL